MRIDLRDGQWADLREHITHAADKRIKRARLVAARDNPGDIFDAQTLLVREFVTHWYVRDPDGAQIALDDEDALDRAPDDIIDAIFEKAAETYTGRTVPNPPTPHSSEGSSPA